MLPAWPGGGPAVPDSEKSDFLVEELERKYLLAPVLKQTTTMVVRGLGRAFLCLSVCLCDAIQ